MLTRGWRFTCQVNTYPTDRGFTAIGTGGDDFVHAMVVAVESVIERQIPEVIFYRFVCQCVVALIHMKFVISSSQ